MFKIKLLDIIFIFCGFTLVNAQENTERKEVVESVNKQTEKNIRLTDDLLIELPLNINHNTYNHSFEKKFQEKYTDEDFDYTKTKARASIWERIKQELNRFISKLIPENTPEQIKNIITYALYAFYIFIFGVVVFILYKVIKNKKGKWFLSKKNTKINPEVNPLEEDIHEINFPETIVKYEQKEDYRMAIRYQFLLVLKTLTDKELINWNNEKTNADYIKELSKYAQLKQFERIVYIFDHIWYGEFPIEQTKYKSLVKEFDYFKKPEI